MTYTCEMSSLPIIIQLVKHWVSFNRFIFIVIYLFTTFSIKWNWTSSDRFGQVCIYTLIDLRWMSPGFIHNFLPNHFRNVYPLCWAKVSVVYQCCHLFEPFTQLTSTNNSSADYFSYVKIVRLLLDYFNCLLITASTSWEPFIHYFQQTTKTFNSP